MTMPSHPRCPDASTAPHQPVEVTIQVGWRTAFARRSRFQCQVRSGPTDVGKDIDEMKLVARSLDGWDVFIDGAWFMGGLVTDPVTGASRPRFPRVADAVIALMHHEAAGQWPPEGGLSVREPLARSFWALNAA